MTTPEPTTPDPGPVEKARAALKAMTKAVLDAGRRYEERMNAATTAALVAEADRWKDEADDAACDAIRQQDRAERAEQERDEFERRYATVLRNLNVAQRERDRLRAGIEALAGDPTAQDETGTWIDRKRVADLLAGSGEQPGEACCDALSKRGYGCTLDPGHPGEHVADDDDGKVLDRWDRLAPVAPAPSIPTLAGRASTGANPAPVVPDSMGLRQAVYRALDDTRGWHPSAADQRLSVLDRLTDAVLAVMGQSVTAEPVAVVERIHEDRPVITARVYAPESWAHLGLGTHLHAAVGQGVTAEVKGEECAPDCEERAACDKTGVGHSMCGRCEHGEPRHHGEHSRCAAVRPTMHTMVYKTGGRYWACTGCKWTGLGDREIAQDLWRSYHRRG